MNKLWIGILIILLGLGFSYGITVDLIDGNGVPHNSLYYDLGYAAYGDGIGGNPDLGIKVCGNDVGGKWVALFYAQNISQVNYIAVSKNMTHNNVGIMTKLGPADSNGCANASTSEFAIILTEISSSNIPNEVAAFPGRVWLGISDSSDFSNPKFFPTDITFLGGYSFNQYQKTYDASTGNISVNLAGITVKTKSSGTQDIKSAYLDDRYIFVGTCEDQYGTNCYDGIKITPKELEGGITLNTGHKGITDQDPHKMYLVVNGLDYPLNLGADLIVSKIDVPTQVYYTQKFQINVTVENIGNVNVTHDFNVSLKLEGFVGHVSNYKLLYNVSKEGVLVKNGGKKTLTFNIVAKGGAFDNAPAWITANATVDSDNTINEINENNNGNSAGFNYKPVYEPKITIAYNKTSYENNGVPYFPYSGRIYNVTFRFLEQPSNAYVSDFTFTLVKEGGINDFVPLKEGVDGITYIGNSITIHMSGSSISIPVIPSITPPNEIIGYDEKIYIESPGNKFFNGSDVVDKYYLKVNKSSYENVTYSTEWKGSPFENLIKGAATYIGRIYERLFQAFGWSS